MALRRVQRETYTLQRAYETVARSLREFGYPDVVASMVQDTHEAMKRGDKEMPHGIVGMFAQRQLEDAGSALDRLPTGAV